MFRTLGLILPAIGFRFSRPVAASAYSIELPSGGAKRCPWLCLKDESLDAFIAQLLSDSGRSRIEKRAGVFRSVSDKTGYFQDLLVIRHSRGGPTDANCANKFSFMLKAYRKAVPLHRLVVPVEGRN